MDLTETILAAAGGLRKEGEIVDGSSLKPVLEGKKESREPLFFHYPHWSFHKENRPGSAIRAGKHKLILRYDDDSVELYDLEADLGEKKNLAGDFPEVAAKLRMKLDDWLKETGAGLPQRRK
jgi:arylsulfatase A-like enzyme